VIVEKLTAEATVDDVTGRRAIEIFLDFIFIDFFVLRNYSIK